MTPDFGPPADLNAYPRRWQGAPLGKTDAMTPLNTEVLDSIAEERDRLEALAREARERGLTLTDETVIFTRFADVEEPYVGRHRPEQINVGRG